METAVSTPPSAGIEQAYLLADVLATTGARESYLAFLVREAVVVPVKARNRRTNLYPTAELEVVRWALAHRRAVPVAELRRQAELIRSGGVAA
jgi:hypothetical protein